MKIAIREHGGFRLSLWLPTALITNGLAARMVTSLVRRYADMQLSGEDLARLFRELRRMKGKYPGLNLVEVRSSDGDEVRIRL